MGNPVVPQLPNQPPGFVSVADATNTEIDPKAFGKLWELGKDEAHRIPKWLLTIIVGFIKCAKVAIAIWISLIDEFLSILADYFQAAQGNSNPAFYNLVANLLTDLTGVEVGGEKIIGAFQNRGRLAAMQEVGGALVDALSGEFGGVYQADKGGVFTSARGSGIAGLPAVELSPEQGMNAARSFMGFAMSFAVREGNTDFFADSLPYGLGHAFKNITEDLAKALGLGRLTRLALKPLFQNMVSIPMTWAFNKQYTPTLLGADQAIRAFNGGLFTGEQLNEELARHGFSMERRNALQLAHSKYPSEADLFLLELGNLLPNSEHRATLKRIGYNDDNVDLLLKAETLHEKRRLSLRLAELLVHPLLNGTIDIAAYSSVLNRFTLTEQEKQDFTGFASELLSHPRKRLTFAQITTAFVDGIVAVDQVAEYLHEEGYREDDIAVLLQIDLFKLKVSKDKAATAAAKAKAKTAKAPAPKTPPAGG
jgi:hypothetical protein